MKRMLILAVTLWLGMSARTVRLAARVRRRRRILLNFGRSTRKLTIEKLGARNALQRFFSKNITCWHPDPLPA